MAKIHYLKGDATLPQAAGNKIIAHICNDVGSWGKGFFMQVSRRWSSPEQAYRAWHRDRASNDFGLGAIQVVQVGSYIHIAHMVAQKGLVSSADGPSIRYDALADCLAKLAHVARGIGASVHMPRIGTGSAGAGWEQVEPIIHAQLVVAGIQVYVYDFV